jgi:hypothetical protein
MLSVPALAGAALAAFVITPSLADYYIIQEPTTKRCRIANARRFALGHKTLLSIVPAQQRGRHHPNPAEALRRWRGKRSEPVGLGVHNHHTRSLCAQSPAQSEQWCCWFGRRRSIFGSEEIAANSCLTAMPLDGSERLLKILVARGPSCISKCCSSNAKSLCGHISAGSPQICAIFQRDNLRRHF